MFDFFVVFWVETMMTYKEGYVFMAMHISKEEVIKHWMKHLPKDAVKLLPRSSSDPDIVNFPMDFRKDAVKWLNQSRKEQSLQGRCREVVQASLRKEKMDELPLPRLIVNYLKEELEPTMCFKVLQDIQHILTIDYYIEELFTM